MQPDDEKYSTFTGFHHIKDDTNKIAMLLL